MYGKVVLNLRALPDCSPDYARRIFNRARPARHAREACRTRVSNPNL